ncbi:unnamed protein product, partial [Hapterophycus canaliculatus]
RRAESETEVRTRFKAIAVVNNQEVINMARLITPFNGKPVLITESGSLLRGNRRPGAVEGETQPDPVAGEGDGESDSAGGGGEGNGSSGGGGGGGAESVRSFGADEFLELDIHVRRWNFMARKGLNKLSSKFGLINVSVAFLVEGRGDAEVRE